MIALCAPPIALAAGPDAAALFAENCAVCHGARGEGDVGPSLIDEDWIWGGDRQAVYETIAYGVRNENMLSRYALMPSFGPDGLLTPEEIADVAQTLLARSGRDAETDPEAVARGEATYANHCATCHGAGLQGDPAMGAPRLSDDVWLFGGSAGEIAAQITEPRHGAMPGWLDSLGEEATRALADHVAALPGGG